MKYPCEDCLVDPICRYACRDLENYFSKITCFSSDYVRTNTRLRRICSIPFSNPYYDIYRQYIADKLKVDVSIVFE